MQGSVQRIKETLADPEGIFDDAHYTDRQVYYKLHTAGKEYLKVVVSKISEASGEVITAYPTFHIKQDEKPIWLKKR